MKKQTAVEWLAEQINMPDTGLSSYYFKQIVKQAKKLEKQQIMDANVAGVNCGLYGYKNSEEYYNKTYKKQ